MEVRVVIDGIKRVSRWYKLQEIRERNTSRTGREYRQEGHGGVRRCEGRTNNEGVRKEIGRRSWRDYEGWTSRVRDMIDGVDEVVIEA